MITAVLPTYARAELSFERGEGAWLFTSDGRRMLDLGAGIAVCSLGHANPKLTAVLAEQGAKLWHVSNLFRIPQQEKLAQILVDNSFADTVFFTNSGTEAIECAVKMVRKHFHHNGQPERIEIITFEGAFHGRSAAGIAASGSEKLTAGFGPLLPGFVKVPFADLEATKAAITERTAAILIEPLQGEGGIRPVPEEVLRGLRALCDEHGLLLIYDEIQCGIGRTGRLFHHQWSGAEPDIMAVAKGIGGGFPLGACLATEAAADGMVVGTHGSTYGGNPLGCAIGCAVMEEVLSDGFLDHVNRVAGRFRQGLEGLVASHPEVFESVRGEGLMLGLKCKLAPIDIVRAGYDVDLITVPAADNVVRIVPPLTLTEDEADEAIRRLDRVAQMIEEKG